ncbi:MAG TPA: cupredoxin domain-containing protein [Mycobacteriales bacterium]|nr:cupredoxin domain-containing protein [Mycobacteriales bacterium]
MGLLLAAAGCGNSTSNQRTPAAASSHVITVTANDAFRFSPPHVTATVGDVTLRLVASGSYPHNISFPQLHVTSRTVGTSIGSAPTTLVRLHDLRPGVYRFVCTFHSKAGMTGELVVH